MTLAPAREYDPVDDGIKSYDVAIAALREKLLSLRREVVGDAHARLQSEQGDDVSALVEDLTALRFELLSPFRDLELGVEELVIDARLHAGVLGVQAGGEDQQGER